MPRHLISDAHEWINEIPTAIAMQHDVDYGVCSNREKKYGENIKKCKHKADKKW